MALSDDLDSMVASTISQAWDTRVGSVVPDTENVKLDGGAVQMEATFLYADLDDSTALASGYDKRVVAKVYKAFLRSASRLIRQRHGQIRSFDGDRVMGVFMGNSKNTSAAKCALNLNWVMRNSIRPRFAQAYPGLADMFDIRQKVGVDTGEVLAVRAGIRGSNDLVWIGRAPNVAAKLCSGAGPRGRSIITRDVYNVLHETAKSSNGQPMWSRALWKEQEVYTSSWWWEP